MAKHLVVLDPGHGGVDPGAVGSGLKEKDLTLKIAQLTKHYIDKNYPDLDCRLTRSIDESISLAQRTNKANLINADCLVSIHINSALSSLAKGFESFRYTTDDENSKSFHLQSHLHSEIAPEFLAKNSKDRGMKRANFHMVREFKGAAVLLELGFIKNKVDSQYLKSDRFLSSLALRIGDGIATYFGVTKDSPGKPRKLYRIIINGRQVGAYGNSDNLIREVEKAVEAGEKTINLQQITR